MNLPLDGRGAVPPAAFPAAQRLEFRDDDLPGALSAYREALRQAKEPLLAGLTMNAVARVQKKSGSLGEAVATYEAIVQDHGEIVIPGGMPLGPSAALEICALTRDLGDFPRSLQTAVRLYRSLLRRARDLEKAEFELFIGRAKDHISALLQDPPAGLDVRTFRTEFRALAVEELGLREADGEDGPLSRERLSGSRAAARWPPRVRIRPAGVSFAPPWRSGMPHFLLQSRGRHDRAEERRNRSGAPC
ncbi:MAG: hypothetical protein M0C28_13705 [Candidatus Moduliflexus flocculans]|nr:hypothetical protein [Candidatus Moduliflexus flocculans]